MPPPLVYRGGMITGARPPGGGGHGLEFALRGDGLALRGRDGREVRVPFADIRRLRVGSDWIFGATGAVTRNHEPARRRLLLALWFRGNWRPTWIEASGRDLEFWRFAVALAEAALARGIRVERGVDYPVPLFFLAIFAALVGRAGIELLADAPVTRVVVAGFGGGVLLLPMVIWTVWGWWPLRIRSAARLESLDPGRRR